MKIILIEVAGKEKHFTYDDYNGSVTAKLIYLQFINAAFLSLIVKVVVQDNLYTHQIGNHIKNKYILRVTITISDFIFYHSADTDCNGTAEHRWLGLIYIAKNRIRQIKKRKIGKNISIT